MGLARALTRTSALPPEVPPSQSILPRRDARRRARACCVSAARGDAHTGRVRAEARALRGAACGARQPAAESSSRGGRCGGRAWRARRRRRRRWRRGGGRVGGAEAALVSPGQRAVDPADAALVRGEAADGRARIVLPARPDRAHSLRQRRVRASSALALFSPRRRTPRRSLRSLSPPRLELRAVERMMAGDGGLAGHPDDGASDRP